MQKVSVLFIITICFNFAGNAEYSTTEISNSGDNAAETSEADNSANAASSPNASAPNSKALSPNVLDRRIVVQDDAVQSLINTFVKNGFASIVKGVTNSVVSIVAVQSQQNEDKGEAFGRSFRGTPFEEFFRNFSGANPQPRKIRVGGSGFIIQVNEARAYIVTNYHIVDSVVKVKIILGDKTELPATVHGTDPRTDLAVLCLEMKNVPKEQRHMIVPLAWGDSSVADVGNWVLAIGNPFGLGNTVTSGIISAKSRDIPSPGASLSDDFIQHSAQINQGNSGGCLIDMNGTVIGINTVIITPSGGNVGIGFAIPSNNARRIIDQLINDKRAQHGALGVSVQDFDKDMAEGLGVKKYKSGAIVARVEPDGPASKAGVQEGDIIVQFDGVEISGKSKLSRAVGDARVDTTHKIVVLRKGSGDEMKELTISVKLGDFDKINGIPLPGQSPEDSKPVEVLGMTLTDASINKSLVKENKDNKGVTVVNIKADSAAEEVGIVPGDVITEVNRKPVVTAREFKAAVIAAYKDGKRYLTIRVRHDNFDRFVAIRIDEDEDLKKMAKGADKKEKVEKENAKKAVKEEQKVPAESNEPQQEPEPQHESPSDQDAEQSANTIVQQSAKVEQSVSVEQSKEKFYVPTEESVKPKKKKKKISHSIGKIFRNLGDKIAGLFK
jgi:serine protease Do